MTTRMAPPQAYTRETLAEAFKWLSQQPSAMKEICSTPDELVGHYLHAKRNGNDSIDSNHPVSSENFRNDLKTIADSLNQFDFDTQEQELTARIPAPTLNKNNNSSFFSLDPLSKSMLEEITANFNLSSDQEALRMLISIGYKKLKPILD